MESYKKYWTNMFNYHGVATRKDFWLATLLNIIFVGVIVVILDSLRSISTINALYGPIIFILYALIILGNLSLTVRRLHDSDHSGYFVFLGLVPIVSIVVLVFMFYPSTPNRWEK